MGSLVIRYAPPAKNSNKKSRKMRILGNLRRGRAGVGGGAAGAGEGFEAIGGGGGGGETWKEPLIASAGRGGGGGGGRASEEEMESAIMRVYNSIMVE